jgi:polyphenol oxidase
MSPVNEERTEDGYASSAPYPPSAQFTPFAPLRPRDCLWPAWPVSPRVRAFATTRNGGVSASHYAGAGAGAGSGGLNLGLHTGDAPPAVLENRRRVLELTHAPAAWLEQVHGARIEDAGDVIDCSDPSPAKADASVTDRAGRVCVVMVADCLPVLLCDAAGRAVGAAHAGWRGLAAGIVEKTAARVASLAGVQPHALHAWLGPAIGPAAFEVGEDVLGAFVSGAHAAQRDQTAAAFVPAGTQHKYFANIYTLARLRLTHVGVPQGNVHGGTHCTVSEPERFYSYRRDRVTGRMAAMIWLAD